MTRKGEIKEWFSRIQYGSEIRQEFSIIFRDFDEYIELSFDEFMKRRQVDSIPLHRITQIRQKGVPVFTRPNFCLNCGNPLQEDKCLNNLCSESV
ncbi:MAG: DUF504 domain-containing protein [Candidatus Heimdallarchaeota archaeon]|nr:MAG: DUF504 domain-containing protein [Candidatus Heimdallarchaeota archaeon]